MTTTEKCVSVPVSEAVTAEDRSKRLRHRLAGAPLSERLLWILDHQQEGVLVSDGSGRIVDLNAAAERLVGSDVAASLLGAGAEHPIWRELHDASGRALAPEELPAVVARRTGRPVRAELRFRDRWFRVEAEHAGPEQDHLTISVFVDVSAEVSAREEAAAERDHVERIAQVVDRVLFTFEILEDDTSVLRYLSPGCERLTGAGLAPGAALEAALAGVHPDDRRRAERHAAAAVRGEPVDVLLRVITAEGEQRWIRAKAIPWQAEDGRRFVDGVLTDLTADRIAHEQLAEREAAQRELALEQAALGRVATTIASGAAPAAVFERLAEELGRLLGLPGAFIAEFAGDDEVVVRGAWPGPLPERYAVGRIASLEDRSIGRCVRDSGRAERVVVEDAEAAVRQRVGAPVFLGETLWGYVGVVAGRDAEIGAEAMTRLELFGRMASTAVASTAARERLVEQATTDPLTTLVNHRVFQERLRTEVARARRHARPLALAVIDLDNFKSINDALGHQTGDEVLRLVARTLSDVARATDTVGRLGGDEFAMLLPETDAAGAQALAERARICLRREEAFAMPLTISAGVGTLQPGAEAADLLRMADQALYRAKAAGRDAVRIQVPGEADEGPGQEGEDQLARTQARVALRALARVIDAKDPSTREHAARVADLASALARLLGWPEPRVALLHEAALLHDVGKVVVPDGILAKPSALDPAEREQVEHHATIGASIAAEVLTSEQAAWIRHHHERPDGTGYPDGLSGDDLPEGAQLLGLADAWDAMTTGGSLKAPKTPEEALEECRRLAGTQFAPRVVEALARHRTARAAED